MANTKDFKFFDNKSMRLYTAKIVGKNVLPEHFRLLVSGPTGSGKTSFVKKLIQSKRLSNEISHVYYCYPDIFDEPPVDWHDLPNLIVTYLPYIPDLNYIRNLKKGSLLVLDDNFENAIKSSSISSTLKIFQEIFVIFFDEKDMSDSIEF